MELPEGILFERRDRIALFTIDRPESMNTLTPEMFRGLIEGFRQFEVDPELWVAVLTASGERAFCAGAEMGGTVPDILSGRTPRPFADPTKRWFSDVFKPIVAAVNGHCVAGGLEMLLGTDIRVAVPEATFGVSEVRWGFVPAGGTHVRLPRQVPWAIAMELLLTGERISAQRAYEVGLLNRVVPRERLLEAALDYAGKLAANAPLAVRTAKEIAVRGLGLEGPLALESITSQRLFGTEDAAEGPRAFKEKRKPDYRAR
jgi:enoyl-CoA hydratase